MKLCLPGNRPLGAGLVALAASLTRLAADQLEPAAGPPAASVHRARVALKRSRSLLRLLEKGGADWAAAPRFRLTLLAGMMSAAREAAVTADAAGRLARRLRGREREVARLLASRKARLMPPDVDQIRQAVRREAAELGRAPGPEISPDGLRSLLRRSLDRADRRYQEAAAHPTLEAVHEWRKAVIILRDQTAVADRRWPPGARGVHAGLVPWARALGRRGDLVLLGQRLQRLRVRRDRERARRTLVTRLATRREQATATALRRWPALARRFGRLLAE